MVRDPRHHLGRRAIEAVQIAADHQLDHPLMSDLRALEVPGIFSIAQHDDTIGNSANLMETMRYINDTDAPCSKFLDDLEKPLCFRHCQTGSRLIHKQNLRVQRKSASDLNHLLLR